MAIISSQTAPNYAIGDYHRLLKAELLCSPDEPVPRWHYIVGFYANEYARDRAPQNPMWTRSIFVPIKDIVDAGGADPRVLMYEQIMAQAPFAGTDAASDAADAPAPEQAPPTP